MKARNYIAWAGITAAVFIILQLACLPLRAMGAAWAPALLFVIKMLLAIAIAFCSMAFCNKFMWNLGYLPGALYAVLFPDSMADLIALLTKLFGKGLSAQGIMTVSLILTAAFFIWGTVNMQTIVAREHTYTSAKLKNTYRFVFMSDLHYRAAQSEKTVKKALDSIKALEPDFLLLGGDITDDRTSPDDMHKLYEWIGGMSLSVFFIYGNHDRQSHGDYIGGPFYTPEDLEKTILDNGLVILRDETYQWAEDLVILGREDVEQGEGRCKVSELPARPDVAYVVCVDHNPYIEDDIRATGADLQLSGHSHAGQVFPLQYVYRLGETNVYGSYRIGDTDLYVSPGISGWYFPFRTAGHSSYEVITLRPAD